MYTFLMACFSINIATQLLQAGDVISVQKLAAQASSSTTISAFLPLNKVEVVLVSKSPKPLFIRAYANNEGTKPLSLAGAGVANNILTLNPNEMVKLTSNKNFSLHAGSNQVALGQTEGTQIRTQLKDALNDRNWISPEKGTAYALYYNNNGLIPGLLQGLGYVKGRTPTSWSKICGLEIIGQDDNQKNSSNAAARVNRIMTTLDQVMRFQAANPRS